MDEEVKERVSTLEAVLGEFIVQSNKSLRRMEEDTRHLKGEMVEFKEEMRLDRQQRDAVTETFKEEMRQDRQQRDADTKSFKEEMRQDRQQRDAATEVFKEEMRQDRQSLNKKWGELANRLGTVAEDIAAPNVRTMANTLIGCEGIDSYSVRVMRRSRKDRQRLTEFDVVISCEDYLFINETKVNPQAEYMLGFVKKLEEIFDFLPEYEGKTVVPVFSSFHLPEPIVQLLTEHNIYAMALGGETMELLNYEDVRTPS